MPFIEPIENPTNPIVKLAYWMIKRKFGKVITPAKIIYARFPSMLFWIQKMDKITENNIPLNPSTKLLVKYYVAYLNDCRFCLDIGEKLAIQKHISTEKFHQISSFKTSSLFNEAEKAALHYAEECNNKKVNETTFLEVKKHFNDKQIIGISYIVATESYYNIMNHALNIESDGLCAIS